MRVLGKIASAAKSAAGFVGRAAQAVGNKVATIAVAAIVSVVCAGQASAVDATLPATGVDVGSYSNALVTNLGTVIGTAIGAGFAIFALWMGFKYVKTAIRGS